MPPGSAAKFNNRKMVRDAFTAQLTKSWEDIQASAGGMSEAELETYKDTATASWNAFKAIHEEMTSLCDRADMVATLTDDYRATSTINQQILALVKNERKKLPDAIPVVAEVKLEKFNGKPTEWVSWRAEFEEKVLNTGLRPTQKLDLLMGALQGEAKATAGRLEKRDDPELQRIWGKLVLTYDNEYHHVYEHIMDIMNFPIISKPSASQFRNMINQVEEHLRLLRRYDVFKDWNAILCVWMLQKLDSETRFAWNTTRENRLELPNVNSLFKFLTDRGRALDNEFQSRKVNGDVLSEAKGHSAMAESSSASSTAPTQEGKANQSSGDPSSVRGGETSDLRSENEDTE